MKILGISGFEGAIPFKRARWPQLDEREYRISQGHDSAAALVVDGAVVAAVAEERINRRKHTGAFPRGAIACCLAEAGVTIDQIDELAHGFDYAPYAAIYALDPGSHDLYRDVYSREALLALVARDFPDFPAERVHHVSHHLAHAASAYYTSGWDECLVVVIDGMGEAHSVSVYCARDGRLDLIFQVAAQDSIGILYSLVTLHLGFDFNADEYKIMGLAPYGDPERFRRFFEEGVELLSDGGICIPLLRMNRTPEERERYLVTRAYLTERLLPSRDPAQEIAPAHRDVAAALQACLDRTMLHLCSHFAAATGQRRRALAGALPRTRAHAGRDRRGPRRVRRSNPGHSLRHPGRVLCGGRPAHRRRPGGGVVSRPHGVRAASARPPQHPRRPQPPGDARPHQRHGENAGGVPAVRASRVHRTGRSLVRRTPDDRVAVHDYDRGCPPRIPARAARHHPRQRISAGADGHPRS